MHPARWLIVGGAGIVAVALALPFLDAPAIGAVNGIDGAAWPALVLLAIPVVLAVTGDRAEGFGPALALVAIALTAVAVLFAVEKLVDAAEAAEQARNIAGRGSMGVGAWILGAGSLLALVGAVTSLSRRVG